MKKNKPFRLLVEGINDLHVVCNIIYLNVYLFLIKRECVKIDFKHRDTEIQSSLFYS